MRPAANHGNLVNGASSEPLQKTNKLSTDSGTAEAPAAIEYEVAEHFTASEESENLSSEETLLAIDADLPEEHDVDTDSATADQDDPLPAQNELPGGNENADSDSIIQEENIAISSELQGTGDERIDMGEVVNAATPSYYMFEEWLTVVPLTAAATQTALLNIVSIQDSLANISGGKAGTLRFTATIQAQAAGAYQIVASLFKGVGEEQLSIKHLVHEANLSVGNNQVQIDFDANEIRALDLEGPYELYLFVPDALDNAYHHHTSSTYNLSQLVQTVAYFDGNPTVQSAGISTYSTTEPQISISIPVKATQNGNYIVRASLWAEDNMPIDYIHSTENITTTGRNLELVFAAGNIQEYGLNGPEELWISIFDQNDNLIVSRTFATDTSVPQVVATPTATPGSGSYIGSQTVALRCETLGATIRYTTNGTTPTSSSPVYSGPITVSANTTLKVKAFKTGMTASAVATFNYTITPTAASLTFSPTNYYSTLPQSWAAVTVTAQAVGRDSQGAIMPNAPISYSISGVSGLSINSSSGVITIPSGTGAGTAIITASSGNTHATTTLTLTQITSNLAYDINGDGVLDYLDIDDITDAYYLYAYLDSDWSEAYIYDLDHSGRIDVADMLLFGSLINATPVATSIAFNQPAYNVAIPNSGSTTTTVSAVVKDQNGVVMSSLKPTYSMQPAYSGVTVNSSTGVVAIQSTAAAGTATIRAAYGSLTAVTAPLALTTATPVATSIAFTGTPYSAQIPSSGSTTKTVTAVVKDQFGNVMSSLKPTLSISPAYSGVTIVSSTGVVTIQSTAAAGSATIRATYGSLTAVTTSLTLTGASSATYTLAFDQSDYDIWVPMEDSVTVQAIAKKNGSTVVVAPELVSIVYSCGGITNTTGLFWEGDLPEWSNQVTAVATFSNGATAQANAWIHIAFIPPSAAPDNDGQPDDETLLPSDEILLPSIEEFSTDIMQQMMARQTEVYANKSLL